MKPEISYNTIREILNKKDRDGEPLYTWIPCWLSIIGLTWIIIDGLLKNF